MPHKTKHDVWPEQNEPAGIYAHIPFCHRKCPYCDFYSITDLQFKAAYVAALIKEINAAKKKGLSFDTLYFGGGTPSILSAEYIEKIIRSFFKRFDFINRPEITLEINPGTIDEMKLSGYRDAGVNRIVIGAQSFQDSQLDLLGRIHSGKDAKLAIKTAIKVGFDNIGVDLIYGVPGQTMKSYVSDLTEAIKFKPAHISCYMLTYESGTRMEKNIRAGTLSPLSETKVIKMFRITRKFLTESGYEQYEISNFANKISDNENSGSMISRHNMKHWTNVPYLGFGPSAHSYIGKIRRWNKKNVTSYIEDITKGRAPIAGKETLNKEQQIMETIYLGLRKTDGININEFEKNFGFNLLDRFDETIEILMNKKLISIEGGRLTLTYRGMEFIDSIAGMFEI